MSRRRKRGRRNPAAAGRMGSALGVSSDTIQKALWAIPGGVAARALPELVLPAQNSGWSGYLLNLGTAIVASMAARRFIGQQAGDGVLIGGIAMTAGRIVADQFGKEYITFASLSGDPAYNLGGMGAYAPAEFVLPTQTQRLLPGTNAAAVMAVSSANGQPGFVS